MINYELKLNTTRWLFLAVIALLGIFAFSDLLLLPSALHEPYWRVRFCIQISAILGLLLFSYTPTFLKYKHLSYFVVLTIFTLSNIWFIKLCWLLQSFNFPYEGLILYSVFAFFVLRLDFKLAVTYVIISSIAFAALLMVYPVYGEFNQIHFGFFFTVNLLCLVGLFTTENAFKRAEKLTNKLDELSQTDQLSGLLNRRAYEKKADKYFLSEETAEPMSIFIIDIDDFKKFNDMYGHLDGDIIIKEQANILKSVFKRDSDVVGRYGGEEFIVIAANTPIQAAELMAGKINEYWQVYNHTNKKYCNVSCSIGLVCLNDISITHDLKSLISQADKALYQAKESGKNCFKSVVYTKEHAEDYSEKKMTQRL